MGPDVENCKTYEDKTAQERFPEKCFCWYLNWIGPFLTYEETESEYRRASADGPAYTPPDGIRVEKTADREQRNRPVFDRKTHASVPVGQTCKLCTEGKECCPLCYTVYWKRRHQAQPDISAMCQYEPNKFMHVEIVERDSQWG
jgi:hypothetical protein